MRELTKAEEEVMQTSNIYYKALKISDVSVCQAAILAFLMLVFSVSCQKREDVQQPLIFSDFPGGNIKIDSIRTDTVYWQPDLRDNTSQDWFYWYFAVESKVPVRLTFISTKRNVMTNAGPAISYDQGKHWQWLAKDFDASKNIFSVDLPGDGKQIRLSLAMPYLESNLHQFLSKKALHKKLRTDTLCITDGGRVVERITLGPDTSEVLHKLLFTARHHSCEMMANYVMEGMIEHLADEVEMLGLECVFIPFVDKDGVEDGDQGKYRIPRDHNRDYEGTSLYASTAAIRDWVPNWSEGKLRFAIDLHCPWVKNENNEHIYFVGKATGRHAEKEREFARLLEKNRAGELDYFYEPGGYLPFGEGWNVAGNYAQGKSFTSWISETEDMEFSMALEFPYALNRDQIITAGNARSFGKDLARAIIEWIQNFANATQTDLSSDTGLPGHS
ncbi:MAG: peptidase M14 [Cyclobacteriaceae bacterium]|nr:peptidase M14 [Cyclobacteriaceae bacterium]